jgi:hypothetical protein
MTSFQGLLLALSALVLLLFCAEDVLVSHLSLAAYVPMM